MIDSQGEGYEFFSRFEESNEFEREVSRNHRPVANTKEVPKIQLGMENRKSRQNGISSSNSLGIIETGCLAPKRAGARIEPNIQIRTF
jgi:hypothetical protein